MSSSESCMRLNQPKKQTISPTVQVILLGLFVFGALWIFLFKKPGEELPLSDSTFYEFRANDINGRVIDFSTFRNKVFNFFSVFISFSSFAFSFFGSFPTLLFFLLPFFPFFFSFLFFLILQACINC